MKNLYSFTIMAALLFGGLSASALSFQKAPSRTDLKNDIRKHSAISTRAAFEAPITNIIESPEGTPKMYDKEAAGTFILGNYLSLYMDNFPATVYWADNGDVYFKNLISVFPDDYYIKGTLSGNTITVPMNQTVEYVPEDDYGVNLGVFKTVPRMQNGEEVYDFELAPEIESISFTVNEDESIDMVLPGKPFDKDELTEYVVGFYYTDDLTFLGYSDCMQHYTKLDLDLITIPSGASIEQYVFVDGYGFAAIVDVAFHDGFLYVRGLSNQLPEATIKAKINGNKATIAQDEYLGIYFDMYYIFTKVLYENPDYVEDSDIDPFIFAPSDVGFELNIAEDKKLIYADKEGVLLSFHCDPEDIFNSLGFFDVFQLRYQDSFAGTPANPLDLEYTTEWAAYQGFNDFFFTISNSSTEGTLLDVEKLYYKVVVNGEPLIFSQKTMLDLNGFETTVYAGVPTEVILMPYLFVNDIDIVKFSANIFDIGIYQNDVTSIGVQTVYHYDDEFTYSDLVTINVSDAVESIISDPQDSTIEYYNLEGRKISRPDKGICVEVIKGTTGVSARKIIK